MQLGPHAKVVPPRALAVAGPSAPADVALSILRVAGHHPSGPHDRVLRVLRAGNDPRDEPAISPALPNQLDHLLWPVVARQLAEIVAAVIGLPARCRFSRLHRVHAAAARTAQTA